MRPSQTILVLEELRNSFSVPLHRKGIRLSLDDSHTVLDIYQQWLLLMVDLGYLHLETLKRDARRLWIDIIHADVLDLNNAFAECLHLVRLQTFKGFKALCKRISTHLYQLIKNDIVLMSQGDVYSAKRLVQAFAYTSRLSLKDIDLTQQMLEEYLAVEEGLTSPTYPEPLVRRLNDVIKRWMKAFDPSKIHAQHGKKGVAFLGRASLEVKYKNLTSDQLLEYAFGEPFWCHSPIRATLDRISETIFVPKSYKTFRTISMEAPTLMYFQQGVWKEIDNLVARSRYLRTHIGFHDQERNKQLACQGSIARNFATIDLSAASDSVNYELVKRVFKGTKLLRFLVATRSKRTLLPDGRLITLKKFAPMGSALCFPVETLIFAAICELATREHRVPGKYSVYGDDIIVPTQCVARTMDILEKLGFRINREKSFYRPDCWFRESCGGEFCDGYDVTPLRVSRKYNHRERDVQLEELISLANDSYKRGFRYLRSFFLTKIKRSGWKPLFAPTSLLSDNYTNYHVEKKWNRRYQRIEARVTTLVSIRNRQQVDSQDEEIRYRHWLESTFERSARRRMEYPSENDRFESVIFKSSVSLQDSWQSKPYDRFDQPVIDLEAKKRLKTRPL